VKGEGAKRGRGGEVKETDSRVGGSGEDLSAGTWGELGRVDGSAKEEKTQAALLARAFLPSSKVPVPEAYSLLVSPYCP
jgi:hypothetical protein